MTEPILEVEHLSVSFPTDDGLVRAVDDLSFTVMPQETLGVVGESGSGKSVTASAILGLLPPRARVEGDIRFLGESLIGVSEKKLREVRGKRIAMVFQDALAALNPVFRVGDQIAEAIKVHDRSVSKADLRERVHDLLETVGIPNPAQRASQYPHEYSGGMRQRAMIAMSIANEPDILIADEPTTALDVTIQAQVLEVFERIQARTNSSVILITHDLGVVAGVADRMLVMYAGRRFEEGSVDDIFYDPRHPYTRGLLAALPRLDRRGERLFQIDGTTPSLIHIPPGCHFHPRCPEAVTGRCDVDRPAFVTSGDGRGAACHFSDSLPPFELPA